MASACPIFRPSIVEFTDFIAYVEKLNSIAASHGICKIIPPPEWVKSSFSEALEHELCIQSPVQQHLSGYAHAFLATPTPGPTSTLEEWKSAAEEWNKKQGMKIKNKFFDHRKLELSFWKNLGRSETQNIPVLFSQKGSLFPQTETKQDYWNLATLRSPLDEALESQGLSSTAGLGISEPDLSLSMTNSILPLSDVPMNLFQANYLHPVPGLSVGRSWYAVPSQSSQKLGRFLLEKFGDAAQECPNLLGHRRCVVSPDRLLEEGIRVTHVAQKPGEIIVLFPGTSHFGFAWGVNIHEIRSFSLGLEEWYPIAAIASSCDCTPSQSLAKRLVLELVPTAVLEETQKQLESTGDPAASTAVAKQRRFVSTRVRKVKEVSEEKLAKRKRKEQRRAEREKEEREKRKQGFNFREGVKAYLKHEGPDADFKEPIEVVVTKLKQGMVYCRTLQEWDADTETGKPRSLCFEEDHPRWTKKPRFRVGKAIKITEAPKSLKKVEAMVKKVFTCERKIKVAYIKPSKNEEEQDTPIVEELDFDSERIFLNRGKIARKRRREEQLRKIEGKKQRRNYLTEYWAKKREAANKDIAKDPAETAASGDGDTPIKTEAPDGELVVQDAALWKSDVESSHLQLKATPSKNAVTPLKVLSPGKQEQMGPHEADVEAETEPVSCESESKGQEKEEELKKKKKKKKKKELPPAVKEVRRKIRANQPDLSGLRPEDSTLMNFSAKDILSFEANPQETRQWMGIIEGVRSMNSLMSFPYREKCRKVLFMTKNERVRSLLIQISHAGLRYSAAIVKGLLTHLYNSVCKIRPELYTDFVDPELVKPREFVLPLHELENFLHEHITIKKPKQALAYVQAMVDQKRGIIRKPGEPRHPVFDKLLKKPKKEKLQIEIPINGWNVVEYIRDIQFKFRMRHPRFNGTFEKLAKMRKKEAVRYVRKKYKQFKMRREQFFNMIRVRNSSEAVFYVRIMTDLLKSKRNKRRILEGPPVIENSHEEIEDENI